MAVKALATITLSYLVDITAVYRYYKMQTSTLPPPSIPTTYPPADWVDSEPAYSDSGTYTLYVIDCNVFSDDSYIYTPVSLSSSYEAAKAAYNKAQNAETAINDLEIGGRNLLLGTGSPSTITGTGVNDEVLPGYNFTTYVTSGALDVVNKTLTLSFYWTTSATSGSITPEYNGTPWSIGSDSGATPIVISATNQNGYYSYTFVLASREISGTAHGIEWLLDGVVGSVSIISVKLEFGTRKSDWTFAPEDVSADINNAAKSATDYMTFDPTSGLIVGDIHTPGYGQNVNIGYDSVDIRDGSTVVASFSANGIEFDKPASFISPNLLINNGDANTYLGQNIILWQGIQFMTQWQTINLEATIYQQLSGIVLAWSYYDGSSAQDYDWSYFFVPKQHSNLFSGESVRMSNAYLGLNKLLYVSNTNITGYAQNSVSGTTNGIAWNNSQWVLRYVIGV